MFCPNDGAEIQEHAHAHTYAHIDAHAYAHAYADAQYAPCPKCGVEWICEKGVYKVK